MLSKTGWCFKIAKMRLEREMFEMQKIKRKKIELVGAHRALEFYGLNEGIDNHITTKDWFHTTRC